MSTITQCPECGTRFRASQAQLEAHQGMVRCGHCQATFNAMHHIYHAEPSPQLPLPIISEEPEQITVETVSENIDEVPVDHELIVSMVDAPSQNSPSLAMKQSFSDLKTDDEFQHQPVKQQRNWLWALAALLLITILLAQATYFFRIELAARLPGLKPALITACDWLKCTIPLPKKADMMSIESSDLEAISAQANVVALNVILRNSAPYIQAYPNLELTLTDANDTALARRVFTPKEYLKPADGESKGFASSREMSIKLYLDTTDLKPTGYRVYLFYP